jgi:hypothetical protein
MPIFFIVIVLSTARISGASEIAGRQLNKDVLFDTEEHRAALNREFAGGLGPDGHLNVLSSCAEVGIVCGVELNSRMTEILDGFSQKRYSLNSIFRYALGKDAQIEWVASEYIAGREPPILSVRPKRPTKILERKIDWDMSRSGEKCDIHELGKLAGLVAQPCEAGGGLSGSFNNKRHVNATLRDLLNYIAADINSSWQVVYSSTNAPGTIISYAAKQRKVP